MKNFRKVLWIFLAASLTTAFYSCEDDDESDPIAPAVSTAPTQNIAEIAIANSRTDSLVVALSVANLVPTFQGAGTFTVFAPTNEAFVELLATNTNWNRISDIDATTLTNVLLYHVLGSKVMSGDLTDDTYAITLNEQGTASGENTVIEVDVTGGAKLNNSANIIAVNIEATNGVIHIIDEVLMPQNVVQIALDDERFTTLVAALTSFGTTYTDVLSGTGPFTVFAPTNTAFQNLLDSDSTWNSLNDIPRSTLEAVLGYHVISGANARAGSLTQNQVLSTYSLGSLTVSLMNGPQLITTRSSQGNVNIIVTDVQGTNGVIHAVDEVLLP
ncbi:MAG: transforming growth factor-beta-induced protein [Vicingaceae bacterium]|jgi:transforming growth factor-beta-induced protein